MAASYKVVPYTLMNPVLWGRLPRELLLLVLARLPVPEITRLGFHLSKEWTEHGVNMEFNRACDDAKPNMAALLSYAQKPNEFSVRIFDFSKHVWLYEYRLRLTNRGNPPSRSDSTGIESVWMPMASDGGLVCFVSIWICTKANPLCIVVINPLTRVQHELPPLQHECFVLPTLVHMKVDSETKGYKVVVIFERKANCYTVETYDSVSREWSGAVRPWGRILGRAHAWRSRDGNKYFDLYDSWECAFDLEKGQQEFLDGDSFQSEGVSEGLLYTLAGDRMCVLHEKLNPHDLGLEFYFITEFQFQNSANLWVPVVTHGQCFLEDDEDFDLHACEDVLMIRNHIDSANQTCCILNFSTSEWHNLPETSLEDYYIPLMCRVYWNVIP